MINARISIATLLGLAMLTTLSGALTCLSTDALAQHSEGNVVQPTLPSSPSMPIALPLGFAAEDIEPEAIADDEALSRASGLASVAVASAVGTGVSGVVSGTWGMAGSPYVVSGDLIITATDTLTIQSGVEVRFAGF